MSFRSRVVAIPLVLDLRMFTDSTSTYKILDLDVPELEGLLPHAEALSLEWLLDQVATNEIDWNIDAFVGWDRDHELGAVAFFAADQTAAGPQLAVPANFTSGNWRRHVRLQLKWRLHTGVSVPKEGKFSAILYVTTKGT